MVPTTSQTGHVAPAPWDLYCSFCFLSFYLKSICCKGCLTGTGVESGSEVLLSPETFVHLLLHPCVAACQMGPHTVAHCPGSSADRCTGPCLATVPLPVPYPVLPGTVQDLSGHIPWWVPSSHQEREQTGFEAVGLCFSPVMDPCCGHGCYRTSSENADRPPRCEEDGLRVWPVQSRPEQNPTREDQQHRSLRAHEHMEAAREQYFLLMA